MICCGQYVVVGAARVIPSDDAQLDRNIKEGPKGLLTLKNMHAKKCTLETATTRSLVILNIKAPKYTTA